MDKTYAILVACLALLVMLIFIKTSVMLLLGKNRFIRENRLAANIMIANSVFTLCIVVGFLHMNAMEKVMPIGACRVYSALEYLYAMFIPAALLIYTIDRLIFIRNPAGYAQSLGSGLAGIAMLVVPWVFATGLTLIMMTVVFDTTITGMNNCPENYDDRSSLDCGAHCYCLGLEDKDTHNTHYTIKIAYGVQSLIALICTITALVMYCCYKKKQKSNEEGAQLEEELEKKMKMSVIAVCGLNVSFLVIYFLFLHVLAAASIKNPVYNFLQPSCLFGSAEGIVFLIACTDTVDKLKRKCCKGSSKN